jgi:hypothetical protein
MKFSELFYREEKFVFCFFDPNYIKNCLSIFYCESVYLETLICFDIMKIKDCLWDNYITRFFYLCFCFIFWIIPSFLFIVISFWMIILFVCCITPTLFIFLLGIFKC